MLSTGVEDDLDRATKMANAAVSVYGMSAAIGPVTIGEKQGQVFVGRDLASMGNVAPAALELVDTETRRMVTDAEETAKQILALNSQVLQDLANSLLRTETLSGPSLDVYMEAVIAWREPVIKELAGHVPPIRIQHDVSHADGEEPRQRRPNAGDGGLLWDSE
jgi:cell division protease FtsH